MTVQGIEPGIGVGVGLSLIIVIYKSAFPRIVTLGRLPNSTVYRLVVVRFLCTMAHLARC